MPTPEELARINIDKQLQACGWIVQARAEMNLYAGCGVAVREFSLQLQFLTRVNKTEIPTLNHRLSLPQTSPSI